MFTGIFLYFSNNFSDFNHFAVVGIEPSLFNLYIETPDRLEVGLKRFLGALGTLLFQHFVECVVFLLLLGTHLTLNYYAFLVIRKSVVLKPPICSGMVKTIQVIRKNNPFQIFQFLLNTRDKLAVENWGRLIKSIVFRKNA